jgi:hypothetical protein
VESFPEVFDLERASLNTIRRRQTVFVGGPKRDGASERARRDRRYRGAAEHDYGDWNLVVRTLAGFDVDRYATVARWPIREGLISYLERRRGEAAREYELLAMMHHVRPFKEKPKVPKILTAQHDVTTRSPTPAPRNAAPRRQQRTQ